MTRHSREPREPPTSTDPPAASRAETGLGRCWGNWSGTAHSRSPAAINSRYQRFFIPAHPLHLPLVADHEIQLQHGFGYEDTGGSQGDPQGCIQADGEPCRRQNAPLEDLAGHGLGRFRIATFRSSFCSMSCCRAISGCFASWRRFSRVDPAMASRRSLCRRASRPGNRHPAVQQQGQDQQDDAHGQKSLEQALFCVRFIQSPSFSTDGGTRR